MYANFHANKILFTIQFINSSFMHYFKLQKLKFKQMIDYIIIDLLTILKFCRHEQNIYTHIY